MSNKPSDSVPWIIWVAATIAAAVLSGVGVKLIDIVVPPITHNPGTKLPSSSDPKISPSSGLESPNTPSVPKVITEVYPDKSRYEGEVSNGMRNGKGTYIAANGEKYTGEWLNDMRHGYGVYVWSNGDTYTGEWRNGLRHGKGTFQGFDGLVRSGSWQNDKLVVGSNR
jgi:hypothetical protein